MTTENSIYDTIIIGAGASGLFCGAAMEKPVQELAIQKNGKEFIIEDGKIHASGKRLILEKTGRAGTKLLMSGNGQCNITHSGSIKEFPRCYGKNGGKIRGCLYQHNNLSLISFLEQNGVPTQTRSDGKVFPASMNARDVLDLLMRKTKENGFEIRYNSPATQIEKIEKLADGKTPHDAAFGVPLWRVTTERPIERNGGNPRKANGNPDKPSDTPSESGGNLPQTLKKTYLAKTLVIASGGCSYPSTGSDGAMLRVLQKDLSIQVSKLRPALSSIQVADYPYGELAGISFENAQITIFPQNSGKVSSSHGEALLFTHKDLSGPAVLNLSKYAAQGDILKINYLYPLQHQQAAERLKAAFHGTKTSAANVIAAEFNLPKRFCQLLAERFGNSIKKLAGNLTGEEFRIASVSGFQKAMATSGGITLSQLNTTAMEFAEHPGLFAIGEALDVDGITGGYNLQFAYSSAKAAANAISPSPSGSR